MLDIMKLRLIAGALSLSVALVACGGTATEVAPQDQAAVQTIELFSPSDASTYLSENPEAVILDVRTPEEFAEGHLEGAVNIDFYAANFQDTLSQLDTGEDYVVYCRSGNRSGQTATMMEELGFVTVHDVDGGIAAWLDAGLPTGGF